MTTSVIEQNFKALRNALDRLKEALDEIPDEKRFIIDASMHRFKFSFELFWKNFKNLVEQQGKEALSPRQVISAAYMMKWFDDEKIWLNMLKDRNLMSHTYKEINADLIYKNIITYYPEMKTVYDSLKNRFNL